MQQLFPKSNWEKENKEGTMKKLIYTITSPDGAKTVESMGAREMLKLTNSIKKIDVFKIQEDIERLSPKKQKILSTILQEMFRTLLETELDGELSQKTACEFKIIRERRRK